MTSQLKVELIRKLRRSLICLAYLFMTCYPWVFVQPGTGRRLVDWRIKLMSVLYLYNTLDHTAIGADPTFLNIALFQRGERAH